MTLIPWRTKSREETGREVSQPNRFRNELDRLFDSFFHGALSDDRGWGGLGRWAPPLDVEERGSELHVRAEIPGVSPDDLEVAIEGDSLIVSGEKKEESRSERESGYVYQERRYGSFCRQIPLPAPVDANDVQADYKDGVLHIRLKKSQQTLPKKIRVTGS